MFVTLPVMMPLFFAISLLFAFAILALMVYRSDLFHETSDENSNKNPDNKTTENDAE